MRSRRSCYFFSFIILQLFGLQGHSRTIGVPNSIKSDFRLPSFFSPVFNSENSDKDYVLRFNNGIVRFGSEDIRFLLVESEAEEQESISSGTTDNKNDFFSESIFLKFLNRNSACRPEGAQPLASRSNYFFGADPSLWKCDNQNFSTLLYKDLYPGITLKYYMHEGKIKYDFILNPGANVSDIQINYSGILGLNVDSLGALNIKTKLTELTDYMPESYQLINGKKVLVKVAYSIIDKFTVGFQASNFDPRYQLVIDPALVYSTFVGGSNDEYEYTGGVSLDAAGNIYVTGRTFSNNFPTTAGVVQPGFGGNLDAFLFKLDPTGTNLLYSTFFGGGNADAGYTTKIDPFTNDIYLTGTTGSANFPTTPGSVQPVFGGGLFDGFVLKINAAGNSLIYSSFLGGPQDDYGAGMDIDNFGNAYIVGQSSGPYPTTLGAYQTSYGGGPWDVWVTKVNPAGNSIYFSTMLGGALEDHCHSIKVDSNFDIYIAGFTTGNFPTTPGTYDVTYNGGQWDTYVTKINSTGTALIFSTYIGGPGADWSWNGLEIDNFGNSYVAGYTQSGFPTTTGAFQTVYGGGPFDAFVYKLNPTGTGLVFSTFVGSSGDDQAWGICLNSTNEIFITGICQFGYPVSLCSFDSTINGVSDAFITHLNATGSTMIFSSYIGGSAADQGYNIINRGNLVYVAGATYSSDFPVTPGAYDTSHDGQRDIMVFQMDMSTGASIQSAFNSPGNACINNVVQFTHAATGPVTSFLWDFGDGTTSNLMNPVHTWSSAGVFLVKLIVSSSCAMPDTSALAVTIHPASLSQFTISEACDLTYSFNNLSSGANSYYWSFGDGSSSSAISPLHIYSLPGNYQVELIAWGNGGCPDTLIQNIVVRPIPAALFSFIPPACNQTVTFQNLSSNATAFVWNFGDGTIDTVSNPVHTFPTSGNYIVSLITEPASCPDTIVQTVMINASPIAAFTEFDLCNFGMQFNNLSQGAATVIWNFGDGITSNQSSPTHIYSGPGQFVVTALVVNASGCRDSSMHNIQINSPSVASFAFPNLICGPAVGFNNSSIGAGSYLWDFGDGTQVVSLNPVHYYPMPGNYTVMLIADPGNCPDTTIQQLTVNAQPTAAFGETTDCRLGYQFINTSVGGINFFWNFGDGTSSAQHAPFHTYPLTGHFDVDLIVENSAGCSDSIRQAVIVGQQSISAFSVPPILCTSSVEFENHSVLSSSFLWDFGDQTLSTEQHPTHYFLNPGIYSVSLITNSGNCPDTSEQYVYVNAAPIADFDKVTDCGLSVDFNSTSFNSYTHLWNFGANDTSSLDSPEHVFTEPGYYQVSLKVVSAAGCIDSISKPVQVLVHANPAFDIAYDTCMQMAIFSNKSTNASTYLWDFSDGQFSNSVNPVHEFSTTGDRSITLITNSLTLCADTLQRDMTVPERMESTLYIPNSFTPNGDGKNECFKVIARGTCTTYELSIFDRWGEMIFTTDDLSNCWDGTFQGRNAQVGVYCYLLKDKDGQKQGIVTLLP